MTETGGTVYFSHGKESGPWGIKIRALAEIAEVKGYRVESPDYTGIPDPDERVAALLAIGPVAVGPLVLVGSSMGAYVSIVASPVIKPDGLFLIAPAIGLSGYRVKEPIPCAHLTTVVHGWTDEVIPVCNVLEFSRRHGACLHLVLGNHRLENQVPFLAGLFGLFLDEMVRNHNLSASPSFKAPAKEI